MQIALNRFFSENIMVVNKRESNSIPSMLACQLKRKWIPRIKKSANNNNAICA